MGLMDLQSSTSTWVVFFRTMQVLGSPEIREREREGERGELVTRNIRSIVLCITHDGFLF